MTSKTPEILTNETLVFNGLSHIRLASDEHAENTIFLLTDTQQDTPPVIDAQVKNSAQFIAILQGFSAMIAKGMLYQASNASSTKDRVSSLMAESDRSVRWHRRLFKLMEKDPESLTAGMDPLLTVRDGVCYLEAFDKTVNRCVTLRLNPSLWLDGGEFQDGSARINLSPGFIQQLTSLNAKDPVLVKIGPEVGDHDNDYQWSGELTKPYKLGLEDVRALLIMQGSSALNIHHVDMVRVDFFNVLRTLRMNKAKTHKSYGTNKEADDIIFHLEPGAVPRVEIQPWGIQIPCDSEEYSGKKMAISVGRKRRTMIPLKHFLPYTTDASFTLFENNLHYCLDLSSEDFQCSLMFAGFSQREWYRRLQMETMLPGFALRSDDAPFANLDSTGVHALTSETLRERKVLIGEILRGQAVFLPKEQTFLRRPLFSSDLDMAKLRVLGPEDDVARTYVANDRIQMVAQYTRDEKLNFGGSTVQEELREGETEPFVAEPRFELHPDGLLRWVGCTCTAFSVVKENGFGGPCAHLRALWLKYCEQMEALREARDAGEDVGPSLVEETHWTKQQEERVVQVDVRRKYMLVERWKKGEMPNFRQTTQVYSTEAKARTAYEQRCTYLQTRGFEQNA